MLSTSSMTFLPIRNWRECDSYEDIFRDIRLIDTTKDIAYESSLLYDTLCGQSWTLGGDRECMWKVFSNLNNGIDDIAVLVKSTVGDMKQLIDYSFHQDGCTIHFNTSKIDNVTYLSEAEIKSWVASIKTIKPEDVMEYAVKAAFLKRERRENGYDYTQEHEVRCVAWGDDEQDNRNNGIVFKNLSPSLFKEFILDPRLSDDVAQQIREQLIDRGIDPGIIRKSSLQI